MARIGLACFACGVILLYCLTVLPPPSWVSLVTVMVLLAVFFIGGGRARLLWLAPALILLGFSWALWHADARLDSRLPGSLEGKAIEVSGYVCGVPEPGSFGSVRFPFCVSIWHLTDGEMPQGASGERLPQRLRLAWYGEEASLKVPTRLRLTVVLKKPHGAVNPRGFRYESWLFRQNYGATGTIRGARQDLSVPCGVVCRYHQWRTDTVENLIGRLESVESAPLIASLMLGYRGLLEPEHWQVLKATGTIHLVAISGLHLGLVAIGAGFLLRRLLVWLPERWFSPAQARLALFVLVCLASLAYALAAGFSVPTRRALIMVVVGCWYVFEARRGRAADAVLFALVLVLVSDPLSPLDQGFWLSFGAVGILTLVFSGLLRPAAWWRSLLLAQVAIFASLWPILAVLDQSQPLVGFVANLVAIPLVSLLIMPAVFLSALTMMLAPALEPFFTAVLDLLMKALWWFLEQTSGLVLPVITPGFGELLGFAVVVALAMAFPFRGFRLTLALTAALWLGVSGGLFAEKGEMKNARVPFPEIRIWDVGQGLSVLVREDDRVLLYDTGPALEGVYSSVESVLLPNLRALGVQRIDTLVISHADGDHSGGVPLLLDRVRVDGIISGEPEKMARRLGPDNAFDIKPCRDQSSEAGPAFTAWQSAGEESGNDASCVLTFTFNQGRQQLILGGDISAATERVFIANSPAVTAGASSFRAILAPHHGSNTSSSPEWVAALSPDLVLFSAGYRHRYGHPHPDVVSRYRAAGSQLLNTATSGALHLTFTPDGVRVRRERQLAPFWIERWNGRDR
jgi:competence protein ComEC